jgi:hypothetical protein
VFIWPELVAFSSDVKSNLIGRDLGVICIQETKLTAPSTFKTATFLPQTAASFVALDADGASGGILTAWDPRVLSLDRSVSKRFSLTCFFTAAADAQPSP